MAKKNEIQPAVPQDELTSEEVAEHREHVARTPQPTAPESSAGALTGHTTQRSVVEDEDGKVVAAHQTTVITDPNDPLAVQIPEGANDGSRENPLAVHNEKTPEQHFADGTAQEVVPQFESASKDEPAEPKPS